MVPFRAPFFPAAGGPRKKEKGEKARDHTTTMKGRRRPSGRGRATRLLRYPLPYCQDRGTGAGGTRARDGRLWRTRREGRTEACAKHLVRFLSSPWLASALKQKPTAKTQAPPNLWGWGCGAWGEGECRRVVVHKGPGPLGAQAGRASSASPRRPTSSLGWRERAVWG